MHFGHPKVVWTLQLKLNSHAVTTHALPHPTQATVWNPPIQRMDTALMWDHRNSNSAYHIPEIEARRQLGLRHGDTSINNRWLQHRHQDGSHCPGRARAPHRHSQADLASLPFWKFISRCAWLACKA